MTKPPAFQFYARDFVADEAVCAMTYEERGVYITLLATAWIEGSIPENPKLLSRLLKITPKALARIWPSMAAKFVPQQDGRLVNPRLEVERVNQAKWRAKSAAGGKAKARAATRRGRAAQKKGWQKGGTRVAEGWHYHQPTLQSASATAVKTTTPLPPSWSSALPPFHDLPPAWWQGILALFPGLDHEAVARDAAAYWTEHPGKYTSPTRFLRHQFARAFARRPLDPYATWPVAWECGDCGEVHETPAGTPQRCLRP